MKTKICSKCKEEKPLSSFHKCSIHSDGLQNTCIDCNKVYYKENKETMMETCKRNYKKNPIPQRKRTVAFISKSIKENELFKTKHYLYSLIRNYYKYAYRAKFIGKTKCKAKDILGMDKQEFRLYIESQFTDGMRFENYNKYWELDHITPLSEATTIEELIKLFHYSNYRPLLKELNRNRKSNCIA